MQIIEKYFPNLTSRQHDQFAALQGLYNDWNAKINVISRKDIDNLYSQRITFPRYSQSDTIHTRNNASRRRNRRRISRHTSRHTLSRVPVPSHRSHREKNQSGTGNSTSYRIAECYVYPLQRRRKQNQIRLHRKPSRHASGRFVETDS